MNNNKFKKILYFAVSVSTAFTIFNANNIKTYAFPYADMELQGSESRKNSGSNYWPSSNLREWLNSSDATVRYTGIPPASGSVGSFPYDKEAGFLSEFTKEEINSIAITERANPIGSNDGKANTNGKTSGMPYNHNSSKSMNFEYPNLLKNWENYGQVVVNDKVFLLTFKELAEYVQNRGWEVVKTPTANVAKKYGYVASGYLAYYIYHPIHNIGNEYIEIVSANPEAISADTTPRTARGVAPAIHLKKDSTVKRIKEYNTSSVSESWTTKTSSVKASSLKIGDIVEFGTSLGEAIQWRVINKTDDGYPLLFAEEVIAVKAFDASGDTARRFSYIDLEDKFKVADVSTKNFQIQNIQGSTDKTQVSMQLLNEDKLFERSNDSFVMNLKIKDDSGIAFLEYPNGNRVNVNSKEYTFNYEVVANDNYVFGLMDVKGNFRYFVLPVGNINLPPKVDISSSTNEWTNQNVTVDIKATNDVGWYMPVINQTTRDHSSAGWGNYTTYIGKQIKITGKVEFVSNKDDLNPASITYGPGYTYKKLERSGDEYNLNWTWPMAWSENLNTLKQRKLNGEPPKEFESIVTVGSNYFGSLSGRTHIELTAGTTGKTNIKWTDIKYELLDNSDFAITKIELPGGKTVNVSSYTDTITKEGENIYSYKVHDNRNMVTEKTITAKIDKSKPTLSITGNPTSYIDGDVALKVKFTDSISGISEYSSPEGRMLGNGQKEIEKEYLITENGKYTFSIKDQAGNEVSQTITVDKIDKSSPTLTYTKEFNPAKTSGFINITFKDSLSGIDYLLLPDNTKVFNQSTYKYPINNNGLYNFSAYDKVGNKSMVTVSVNELNTNIVPSETAKIEYKLTGATNKDWTVYTTPFYIVNEGITYITARSYDKAGNLSSEETSQVKIDKTKPINNGIKIELVK